MGLEGKEAKACLSQTERWVDLPAVEVDSVGTWRCMNMLGSPIVEVLIL